MDGLCGWIKFIGLVVIALAITVASRDAQAYPFYFDVQGGLGEYLDTTSALFASGTSGATGYGLSGSFGLFYTPIEPSGGLDIQLGLQTNFLSASQGSNYYSTIAPYPAFRVQFWMLYATAGLTPFVWRRSQGGPGLDNYSQAQNTLAYLGEVGALYAATPKFSMGGALNFQWFSSSGVFDAQPSVSLTFVMRFYFSIFGIGQDGPTQGDPLEYRGWRYIGK